MITSRTNLSPGEMENPKLVNRSFYQWFKLILPGMVSPHHAQSELSDRPAKNPFHPAKWLERLEPKQGRTAEWTSGRNQTWVHNRRWTCVMNPEAPCSPILTPSNCSSHTDHSNPRPNSPAWFLLPTFNQSARPSGTKWIGMRVSESFYLSAKSSPVHIDHIWKLAV